MSRISVGFQQSQVWEEESWITPTKRSDAIICRFFAPHTCNRLNALSWLWDAKNRQMMLFNFLIIFCYLMLNQIFLGLSTKIFPILHKLDKNNHLNSSCRPVLIRPAYITFEHIIKLNTQPKTTRISTRLYLLLVHLPHAKSISDKRRKFFDLLFTP